MRPHVAVPMVDRHVVEQWHLARHHKRLGHHRSARAGRAEQRPCHRLHHRRRLEHELDAGAVATGERWEGSEKV